MIKAKHQSGLPVEYTLLEFIESTGTQYIETGVYLDYGEDIRITGTVVNKTANKRKVIVGNYSATNTMSLSLEFAGLWQSGLTSNGFRVYFGNKTSQAVPATLYSNSTAALPLNTDIDFDFVYTARTRSFTLTCIANGRTYTLSDVIPNMFDAVSDETMTLFLDKRTDPSSIQNSLTIKAMSITNDVTAKEYVPVNKGNNAGMYDTVGGAFYANAGTNAFVGGSSVADPLITYIVGTPEVLTVSGANMLNPTTVPNDGKYIAKNGPIAGTASTWAHSDFIPIEEGKKYYFGYKPFTASVAGMAWYDSSKTFISGKSATEIESSSQKLTAPSGASFVRFTWSTANGYDTDWRNTVYFCEDGAMTKFEPYVTPQTASVENLFAVGDYADEQDIISGLLTHKVGIKVFDGTERWREATHKGVFFTSANMGTIETTRPILCNAFSYSNASNANMPNYTSKLSNTSAFGGAFHFVYDEYMNDVDGFTAWLAAQYAAGTPVIVVYPLAEETTESVTHQPLTTTNGTNTVTATAEVSDI